MKELVFISSMGLFVKAMWEICSNHISSAFLWTMLFCLGIAFFGLLYRIDMVRRMKAERRIR